MGDTNCPSCGLELAEGSTIAGRRELTGVDVSICWQCGEILVVLKTVHGVSLRLATAGEFLGLPEDSQTLLRVAFELVKQQARVEPPLN